MLIRFLSAAIVATGLSGATSAATISQEVMIDPFSVGPAVSDADDGWVKSRGKFRRFFDGFDTSLGTITGAQLIIHEAWTLDTVVTSAGGDAGVRKAKGRATTRVQVGTRKSTDFGPFRQRLSAVRTKNAVCETVSDSDSCTAGRTTEVDTIQAFLFDVDRAQDLFLDRSRLLIGWNVRTRLRGSGLAEAWIQDGSIKVTLNVDYDLSPAAVPLPASGMVLITAFGSLALLRRRKVSAKI